MTVNTCDLYDLHGDEARVIGAPFVDFGGRAAFSGKAVTIKCFEDNSRLKELSREPGRGKVLVVDGGGSLRAALMGDMIAEAAARAGWEGVIIFGCIRDTARLRTLDLGIKALAATPRKSARNGEGKSGVPVQIAGVWIRPGERIFADEDGILILGGD